MNAWFTVEQITETIYAICEDKHWEQVRSYLFVGEDTSFLIDSGTGIFSIKEVVNELSPLPIQVLTTHVHWDHIGNHHRFDKVFVHTNEADWMRNGIPVNINIIRQSIIVRPFELPSTSDFDIDTYYPPTVQSPTLLEDGMRLSNGRHEFEIFHTPGHSPGSLSFLEKTHGLLVTGDLIYRGVIYANYSSTDPLSVYNSIRRLSKIQGDITILPGHNDVKLDRSILDQAMTTLEDVAKDGKLVHGSGLHKGQEISFLF
jgi:glyoxylase-like metal-dependent hydrolase (beta-lactamase superfamily II)